MMIGSEDLLEEYGTRLKLAEALVEGKLSAYQEYFATAIIDRIIMQAAIARIAMRPKMKKDDTVALEFELGEQVWREGYKRGRRAFSQYAASGIVSEIVVSLSEDTPMVQYRVKEGDTTCLYMPHQIFKSKEECLAAIAPRKTDY